MQRLNLLASRIAFAACVALLPVAVVAQAGSMSSDSNGGQSNMSGKATVSDKKFVMDAAEGGMAEVELGKLATEKASSPDVKQFGQRMAETIIQKLGTN